MIDMKMQQRRSTHIAPSKLTAIPTSFILANTAHEDGGRATPAALQGQRVRRRPDRESKRVRHQHNPTGNPRPSHTEVGNQFQGVHTPVTPLRAGEKVLVRTRIQCTARDRVHLWYARRHPWRGGGGAGIRGVCGLVLLAE